MCVRVCACVCCYGCCPAYKIFIYVYCKNKKGKVKKLVTSAYISMAPPHLFCPHSIHLALLWSALGKHMSWNKFYVHLLTSANNEHPLLTFVTWLSPTRFGLFGQLTLPLSESQLHLSATLLLSLSLSLRLSSATVCSTPSAAFHVSVLGAWPAA